MEKFVLVLGKENNYLPGSLWTEYEVEVLEEEMICTCKKNPQIVVTIRYEEFKEAEFGIGNGNLWLECNLTNGSLVFCSPRKVWKSPVANTLIEKINSVTAIEDMKAYKQYTGPFFFIHMFK